MRLMNDKRQAESHQIVGCILQGVEVTAIKDACLRFFKLARRRRNPFLHFPNGAAKLDGNRPFARHRSYALKNEGKTIKILWPNKRGRKCLNLANAI